jgi:hypothetical protein
MNPLVDDHLSLAIFGSRSYQPAGSVPTFAYYIGFYEN